MKKGVWRAQAALVAATVAMGIGCRDMASPEQESDAALLTASVEGGGATPAGTTTAESDVCETGQINVTITTSGDAGAVDPDLLITLDEWGGPNQTLGANASATFTGVPIGRHDVYIDNVASNCTVTSAFPQTLTVEANGTAQAAFTVNCRTLTVTVAGAVGGPATPGSDRIEFELPASSRPDGRLFLRDWREVQAGGTITTLTVDQATIPTTRITSFTRPSANCVRVTGIGRLNLEGGPWDLQFVIEACDNGTGAGIDAISITLPDDPAYRRNGVLTALTEGDIVFGTN